MTTKDKAGAAGQAAALPVEAEASALPSMDTRGVLGWLGARALRNATDEELTAFAGLAADAEAIAHRGAVVANGVAFLVMADSDGKGAGNFRDSEAVADLLLHLGDTFGLVAGLISISEQAEDGLRRRAAQARVSGRSVRTESQEGSLP